MSSPHDPPSPSFPFGNPFRLLRPKGSYMTPELLALLNPFEERLRQRLMQLRPENNNDILSLSWMQFAMELLCETHNDIKALITDLELPICEWEDEWIDKYLNNSVKLLDLCIAFNSEISRLNQGHLMLKCALYKLNSESSTQFTGAQSSIDGWKQFISIKNPRLENCWIILESLVKSIEPPKVKSSAKGNVLMRAMYGVKAETIFTYSLFAVVFTGSACKLTDIHIPETYLWADAFSQMQSNVNRQIRDIFSCGKKAVLSDAAAVDNIVKRLYPKIEESTRSINLQGLHSIVTELEEKAEDFWKELDLLAVKFDSFFQTVLTGRDALLCNLRATSPAFGSRVGESSEMGRQMAVYKLHSYLRKIYAVPSFGVAHFNHASMGYVVMVAWALPSSEVGRQNM